MWIEVLIPLKSGKFLNGAYLRGANLRDGLNPFEVREVSKPQNRGQLKIPQCLNPFEVREVSKLADDISKNHASES